MNRTDRLTLMCLLGLIFDEAQMEAIRWGHFVLPWGVLDSRPWAKQTYQYVQWIVLGVSVYVVCAYVQRVEEFNRARFGPVSRTQTKS